MNQEFKQFIIDYFTDREQLNQFIENDFPETEIYESAIRRIEESKEDTFSEFTEVVIKELCSTSFYMEECICQYEIVQALAKQYSFCGEDYYRLLFELYQDDIMSVPAYDILFCHYGEILSRIFFAFVPSDLSDIHQKERLQNRLFAVLSDYVLKNILIPHEAEVYEGDYYDEDENRWEKYDEDTKDNPAPWRRRDKLMCCVCNLDKKDYKWHSNVRFIAAFADEGMNTFSPLIENLITFVNRQKPDQTVTYQIVGRTVFDTCKEMIGKIGAEAFGCSDKTAESIIRTSALIGKLGFSEKTLALNVKKISVSVLKAEDLMVCQNIQLTHSVTQYHNANDD